MPKRTTYEEFSKKFYNSLAADENYTLLSNTYTNNRTKVKVRHEDCGLEYYVTPDKFLRGRRCPSCWKKDTETFKEEVFNFVGDEYTVLGEYINKATPIEIKHNTCGRIYKTQPAVFLKGHRCASCSQNKKTNDEFQKEVFDIVGTEYTFLEEYKNNKKNILVKHNTCNHRYMVSPTNFLAGYRCPRCSINLNNLGVSKLEKEIFDFIENIYNGKIIENYRFEKNLSPAKSREIDIFLPDIKIGIEIDGLYFHSEKNGKDKNYHLDKTMLCKNLGIRLIHILEDEWINKKEIVQSKLKHILNISDQEKVYARNTIIREITNKEKTPFLEKYHIQGSDQANIKLGEYYNDELVAVMTFTKLRRSLGSRKSEPGQYELSRFATSKNVVGGFSKMLKYAVKNCNINYIKTFADLRWSDFENNVYETNGFLLSHVSSPNYFYVPNSGKIRYHRFNFRKNILEEKFPEYYDKNLTEFQIMDKTNYSRIWDCGNLVYEMKIER